jgi:mono/diheme cytochrome c family protein
MRHGGRLFDAAWTVQEGGGRPALTGTGNELADPDRRLEFPFNMNRVSAPDANACGGCHNLPRAGGGGDFVTNVFVLGQRFDFATFDVLDVGEEMSTRGAFDENGDPVTLQTIANSRATLGMFGSGYIEMAARQMTADLQAQRDSLAPGGEVALFSKGISFGTLSRASDGSWDTSRVEGLVPPSLASAGPDSPPNLIIRPFHQAAAVISLREFTNNAMNHHHGIQSVERFGEIDADGDGFDNNLSVADMTAVSAWQAQLAVPGRVIPRHPVIEEAVANGERLFIDVGCADCHVPALPLTDDGWIYTEPNPYNPEGNLRPGDYPTFAMDLNDPRLEQPRLAVDPSTDTVWVPAFTDLKVYDITTGPDDPNCEPLNMHFSPGSEAFHGGNCRFLTKKLWGAANEPPYFHHGKFTTMREAIEAHHGDAQYANDRWAALDDYGRDSIIEFLKTLQVLPEGTMSTVVDEHYRPRSWDSAFD